MTPRPTGPAGPADGALSRDFPENRALRKAYAVSGEAGKQRSASDGDAEEHMREVVLFLRVHIDRTPGILWPAFNHPVFDFERDPTGMGMLERGLSARTGMPVSTAADSATPLGRLTDTGVRHLLVHQCSGSSTWSVFPGMTRGTPPVLSYTLRRGEVLYAPPGRACSVEPSADSRWVVSRLAEPPAPADAADPAGGYRKFATWKFFGATEAFIAHTQWATRPA